MIEAGLLKVLVCPETKQKLRELDSQAVDRINTSIRTGKLKNRAGEVIEEPIEAALLREDGKYAYPVRRTIPVMLTDESFCPAQDKD
jgi:uncharacterized protein YbaR (Trm112 family)